MTPEYKALIRSRAESQEDKDFAVNARRFVPDLLDYVEKLELKLKNSISKDNTVVLSNDHVISSWTLEGFQGDASDFRDHLDLKSIQKIAERMAEKELMSLTVIQNDDGDEIRRTSVILVRPKKVQNE